MSVSRFLKTIILVTIFCVLYVHQQAEIFRLAYVGQKKLLLYEELLDKNVILRYNLERGASVVQIGNKVSESADFQMPDSYRLVRVASTGEALKSAEKSNQKESLFSRIFGVKRQAEAKTIP